MTVFADKLGRLTETIELGAAQGAGDLAQAIASGRGRVAVAIGSGGSMVTAEYFAHCRSTLRSGVTVVMTPMQFVLSIDDWHEADVWLFSAGAKNPDIAAAFRSATASACRSIRFVTVRPDGATAVAAAAHQRSKVFVLPVADPKDGFLATHSMLAMVTGLLFACDRLADRAHAIELEREFLERSRAELAGGRQAVADFRKGDTLILLHDPHLAAVSVLIETSLWETGIAPVQRTDFRNFAHGRHVWAARHPQTMFVLALTTCDSAEVWTPIREAIPAQVRRGEIGFGYGGRLDNAVGIVAGLAVLLHLGETTGIDPGRPGRGPFAEAIYDNPGLEVLAVQLSPAVRHKAAARFFHDPCEDSSVSLCVVGRERTRALGEASFRGVALDYDGTVVPNTPREARLGPPNKDVMDELVRLVDDGIRVGFATGRGGSAAERLREVLPERVHSQILMGYYNGAHVRTLDVDIRHDAPPVDLRVAEVAEWITTAGLLRAGIQLKVGNVQVTADHIDVIDVEGFADALSRCPAVAAGTVRVLSSQHSFDVVPVGTTKLKVVDALVRSGESSEGLVLGIGDSGSPLGNDFELLSGAFGISVDSVCGSHLGAWTVFGSRLRGPDALARILRAARTNMRGMSIDTASLCLDDCA